MNETEFVEFAQMIEERARQEQRRRLRLIAAAFARAKARARLNVANAAESRRMMYAGMRRN